MNTRRVVQRWGAARVCTGSPFRAGRETVTCSNIDAGGGMGTGLTADGRERAEADRTESDSAGVASAEVHSAEFDIVVAGSGAAGMTAALTAAHRGASVVVLEKTGVFGGSTARS